MADESGGRFSRMLSYWGRGGLAGLLAALLAVGVSELYAGIFGGLPSLLVSMSGRIVDLSPRAMEEFAISVFGTSDKLALVIFLVVLSGIFGFILGVIALRSRPIAVAGFAAFGLLAGFANGFDAQSTPAHGVAMAAVSAGLAIVALLWFTRANPVAATAGDQAADLQFQRQRRVFLGSGAVVALAAVVTGVLGRNLIEGAKVAVASREDIVLRPVRSRAAAASTPAPTATASETPAPTPAPVATAAPTDTQAPLTTPAPVATAAATEAPPPEATVAATGTPTPIEVEAATGSLPTETMLDVRGISPLVTPNRDFYRIDTAFSIPRVDVEDWELKITGLVDSPYSLTYRELLDLATDEDYVTLCCVSNEVGGRLIGNAKWQGIPLADVLDRAGIKDEATQIVGRSVDGFSAGFPREVAFDGRPVLVAVGMNGEPLPFKHGFPARLVVSGLYGYVSATKWLQEIELTTWEGFDGYWIPRGWSKEGPIKTQSRIDVPKPFSFDTAPGLQAVAGVAWAQNRGISKVEVQIDGDGEWKEAKLSSPISKHTWVQWVSEFEFTPGSHFIRVRATDSDGELQAKGPKNPAPNGAEGWHQVNFRVTDG
ncbi:MAG: molybdopterin-dependent oxidoreductase [Chloroflexi bacterium]|nr:molybdopterin-dependent oxidoreductase [Chloroflexota bacterium]